jgi:ATP/ADP translocase
MNNNKERLLTRLHFYIFGATIVGETAVTSLVVSHFGAPILNKLYLLNGVLLFLLPTFFFSKIDRVNRGELFRKLLKIAASTIVVLSLTLILSSSSSIVYKFSLILFYPLSYLFKTLLFLTFWTVATDISNSSEAKNMFPEVAAFGFIGGLSGAIVSRVLLISFSTELILLFWALLYLVAYRMTKVISKVYNRRLIPVETIPVQVDKKGLFWDVKTTLSSPLIGSIALLYYTTFVSIFLIDYHFWMKTAEVYRGSSSLTSFQYSFYILYSIITILTLRHFTSGVIGRKGFTEVFSYLPKTLFFSSLFYIVVLLFGGDHNIVFFVLLLWQLLRYVVFENFFSPVYQMFFAAIEQEKRGRAKTVIEGVVKPAAIISASIFLMLLGNFSTLIVATITLFSAIMIFLASRIKKVYMDSLLTSVNSRVGTLSTVVDGLGSISEQKTVELLDDFSSFKNDDMKKLAIDILLRINKPESINAVISILKREDSSKLYEIVAKKIKYVDSTLIKLVEEACQEFGKPKVNSLLLYSLASIANNSSTTRDFALRIFHLSDGEEKFFAALYLSQNGNRSEKSWVKTYLTSLMFSDDVEVVNFGVWGAIFIKLPGYKDQFNLYLHQLDLVSYKESLYHLVPDLDKTELYELIVAIAEMPKSSYRIQFSKVIKDAGLQAVAPIDLYLSKEAQDSSYSRLLIKRLVDIRENNIGVCEQLKRSNLFGLYNFAIKRCENAYQLAAQYYFLTHMGHSYSIRKSVKELFEEALREQLNEAADLALDALVIIEGYSHLINGRREFNLANEDERVSLIEFIETVPDGDLKDMLVPILENSDWETYYDVGQRFFKVELDTSIFLKSDDSWVTYMGLLWHYEILHDIPHEDSIKSCVLKLQKSNKLRIKSAANMVAEIINGGDVVDNRSLDILERVMFFKESSLFSLVTAENLMTLAEDSKIVKYKKGDVISREGDMANHLYLMKSGKAELRKSETNIPFDTIVAGESYGELGLFNREIRSTSAVSTTDCELYVFSRTYLKKMIVRIPDLANNLLSVFGRKLLNSNDEIIDLKEQLSKIS